mgnify:CR=1 FL=1
MADHSPDSEDTFFDLSDEEGSKADELHQTTPIVDGLVAGTYYLDDPDYRDHLLEAGITAGNLTVGGPNEDFEATVNEVSEIRDRVQENNDNYYLVQKSEDIDWDGNSDRTGIVLGFQGANWLGTDLDRLRTVDELDVKVIDLTVTGAVRGVTQGLQCSVGRLSRK